MPKIFVSSTIYDFKDLRSSLKFYLEELDYEVNMSEFNDFQKVNTENTYEACFEAIKKSDYYVLLIGSRKGGLYDKNNNISITQQEYRVAYEEFQKGNLRIIIFVRDDIWKIKQDRKSLQNLLKEKDLIDKELAFYSSNMINDAEFIFNFLDEVSRNAEMKESLNNKSLLPKGNWIHTFSNFKDIVDTLRVEFNMYKSLSDILTFQNFKQELLFNLQVLLNKSKKQIDTKTFFLNPFINNYKLDIEHTKVKKIHLKWLLMGTVLIHVNQNKIKYTNLRLLINNGFFLNYDTQSNEFTESLVHKYLLILEEKLDDLISFDMKKIDGLKLISENQNVMHLSKEKEEELIQIKSLDYVWIIILTYLLNDIINISKGLFLYFENDKFDLEKIKLSPKSPFKDMDEELKKEIVSVEEIKNWIRRKT